MRTIYTDHPFLPTPHVNVPRINLRPPAVFLVDINIFRRTDCQKYTLLTKNLNIPLLSSSIIPYNGNRFSLDYFMDEKAPCMGGQLEDNNSIWPRSYLPYLLCRAFFEVEPILLFSSPGPWYQRREQKCPIRAGIRPLSHLSNPSIHHWIKASPQKASMDGWIGMGCVVSG